MDPDELQNDLDANNAPETEVVDAAPIETEAQEVEYDPAQVYADEEGNEWKPNESTGEWEIVAPAEDVPAVAPVATAQTETSPAAYKPAAPTMTIPGMSKDEQDKLAERMITDGPGAVYQMINHALAQHTQAQAVASWQIEQQAAIAPEFVRIHGRAMESYLATMTPEKRVTKEAVQEAAAVAVWQEIKATGDIGGTFKRAAELFNPTPAAKPKAPAAPPRLLSPSQRATAPTVAPNRDRPHVSGQMKKYLNMGLTREESQKIINLQNKRG